MLVQEGIITEGQLDEALTWQQEHGGKLVQTLIGLGFLDTTTFVNFLSRQPGVASIDLRHYTIPQEVIDLVSAEFCLRHEILPMDKLGKYLTVGMACPLDSKTVEELETATGLKIRPLLASMKDIRAALERYYAPKKQQVFSIEAGGVAGVVRGASAASGLNGEAEAVFSKIESGLTFEGVVRLVKRVTALPALPETVSKVRAAMEDSETSTVDVAEMLKKDPALAAKVIGLANSAAFGFPHRIDSVELATALLGLREVYSVVLSAAVIDYFTASKFFDYKKFWERSLFCATAARTIGKRCGRKSNQGLFAAGLLYDLGKAVLAEVAPVRYAKVDQNLSDGELIARENELFGIAHPEVGYILAQAWKLPVEIAAPIRFHHNVMQATDVQGLVGVVALASAMTDARGHEDLAPFIEESKVSLQLLELAADRFGEILEEATAAMEAESQR